MGVAGGNFPKGMGSPTLSLASPLPTWSGNINSFLWGLSDGNFQARTMLILPEFIVHGDFLLMTVSTLCVFGLA